MTPSRRPTIREVALEAGVSVATVSKVLNNRYGVAEATAERVRAVVDDLGYESSLVARSLRTQQTNVIGVLVADLEPFSAEVLKGVADVVRGTGYELVAYAAASRVGEHIGWERRHLSRLGGTLIDGAVMVTPTVTDISTSVPIVAVDPHAGHPGLPVVDADNLNGGHLAAEHLLDLGHRRIAMLTGRADLMSAQLREQGFRAALGEAGIPAADQLFVPGDYDPDVAEKNAYELLTRPDRPTAIFAANDATALATLEVARRLGIDLPGALSVIGFDNIPDGAMCTPGLTTVEQPIREMGRRAAKLLLDRLTAEPGTEEAPAEHIRLDTRLVVRGTTAHV
ncbi:MAG: LacI family transcriptional regulator [Nocardioidaceae bacterium]|nr:LacI family transcriptional regulator [Nocardioidaceae bacterium]MCL2613307.1 LacI family transcriptional regulator [Nocardioidaceae bacterium]